MKTEIFQSCGLCWVFQICWHIQCSTLKQQHLLGFETDQLQFQLALFVVMLSKAHLPSHSRMSGSRWADHTTVVIGVINIFLWSSSVYFCHLFFISSASHRFLLFLSLLCLSLHEMLKTDLSNFCDEISSLSHCIIFFCLYTVHLRWSSVLSLLFSRTLHSVRCIFPFFPCLSLLFFPQLFVRPPQTTTMLLHFFFFGTVLVIASCTMVWTFIHGPSGTLSTIANPLSLFVTSTVQSERIWFRSYWMAWWLFLCMCAKLLQSCLIFVTLWTVAHQAPLSIGILLLEYWCGLPYPPPGALPDPAIESASPVTPALQANYLLLSHQRSPWFSLLSSI